MNFNSISHQSIFLILLLLPTSFYSLPILNAKLKNPTLNSPPQPISPQPSIQNTTTSFSPVITPFDISECEMMTDGPVCLFNSDRMILPYALPPNLNGYWNFDTNRPIDNSGHNNHGIGSILSGPSFGGFGASALVRDGNYITVPHNKMFSSNQFTITFFVYFYNDPTSFSKGARYCPIVMKGKDDLFAKQYQRAPGIFYDKQGKNLLVFVKTGNDESAEGEGFTSKSRLTPQKWYHIAVVKTETSSILYVNGIKETELVLKGAFQDNDQPLYIGNVPWLKNDCAFPFLIDEMRYYNKAVDKDYIQAEASPVLGGVEPSFIQLGCFNCDVNQAATSCNADLGYRLCTSIELHTGGYQVARALGLINSDTHIWTHNAFQKAEEYKGLTGLGLCCSILK